MWGHRQIGSISRRDVLDVIDAVADRGSPITARRLIHTFTDYSGGLSVAAP